MEKPYFKLTLNSRDYLLLGDSMLRRLFSHVTSSYVRDNILCHGGQSIQELTRNLKESYPRALPLSNVLLMIGTNNLHIKGNEVQVHYQLLAIKQALGKLAEQLVGYKLERIAVISLPILPKYSHLPGFGAVWEGTNRHLERVFVPFIKEKSKGTAVTFVDVRRFFEVGIQEKNVIRTIVDLDRFHRTFPNSDRVDLIHWNEEGMLHVWKYIQFNLRSYYT